MGRMAETGLGLARAGLFPPYHLHVTALPAEERDLPGIGNRLKQKGFDYLQVILVTPAGDWSIATANLKFTGIQVIFVAARIRGRSSQSNVRSENSAVHWIVDKFTSAAPAVDWNRTMANLKILPNSGFADKFPCFLLTIPLRFIALNQ
jgi:hypothetical protein